MSEDRHHIACDVAIIGDSVGAVGAALALGRHLPAGRVLMLTASRWLGGQITAQGVSALDEHDYVERSGTTTAAYHDFRRRVRAHYQRHNDAPAVMASSVLGDNMPFNPGDAWVSRLAFDPRVGVETLEGMLPPNLTRLRGEVVGATMDDGRIVALHVQTDDRVIELRAAYYIDATDTGEVLPHTGTAYVTGAEAQADTGESAAPLSARPDEVQGFTFPFAVMYCAGEDHTIPEPPDYQHFREMGVYTLAPTGHDGQPVPYRMFTSSATGNLPFWSYRRIHAAAWLGGRDVSLINWVSNDYYFGDILNASAPDREHHLTAARRLSLGFLYWLQTECPRDDGGRGYPEFQLLPDVMGTADGLSQQPYIRESRRIRGLVRVVEDDISAAANEGARARHFADSGGIGWYAMDLHPCVGNPRASRYAPTRPFQVPLGALIPADTVNLIAGCKNIATTHLTNGAYRVHPAEWAVGEMAGTLAAYSTRKALSPAAVWRSAAHLSGVQADLISAGCPVAWAVDVAYEAEDGTINPLFAPTQHLLAHPIVRRGSERWHSLEIMPERPLGDDFEWHLLAEVARRYRLPPDVISRIQPSLTWGDLCRILAPQF